MQSRNTCSSCWWECFQFDSIDRTEGFHTGQPDLMRKRRPKYFARWRFHVNLHDVNQKPMICRKKSWRSTTKPNQQIVRKRTHEIVWNYMNEPPIWPNYVSFSINMQSIVDKKIQIKKSQDAKMPGSAWPLASRIYCWCVLCSEGTLTMDILKHYNLQYVAVQ